MRPLWTLLSLVALVVVPRVQCKSWSLTLNVRVAPGARDCFFISDVKLDHEVQVDYEVRTRKDSKEINNPFIRKAHFTISAGYS